MLVAQTVAVGVGDDKARALEVDQAQRAIDCGCQAIDPCRALEVEPAVLRQAGDAQVQRVVAGVSAAVGGDGQADDRLGQAAAQRRVGLPLVEGGTAAHHGRLVDRGDGDADDRGVGLGQWRRAVVDQELEPVGGILVGAAPGGVRVGQRSGDHLLVRERRIQADALAGQRDVAVQRHAAQPVDDLRRRLASGRDLGIDRPQRARADDGGGRTLGHPHLRVVHTHRVV